MLYLVGIGLSNFDIPVGLAELCRRCEVYVDRYTTFIDEKKFIHLTSLIGREPIELSRAAMEENIKEILKKAKEKDVAILIGGDPLVATTHKIMYIGARKAGVPVKTMHASSGISALLGESGLDFYRFGQICTISRWSEHYTPVSFYETIQRNRKANLHSLVLLDYDPVRNSSLELREAVRILEEAEKKYGGNIVNDNTVIFIMHKIGLDDQQKMMTTMREGKRLTFGVGPTAIIIPGELADVEKDVVESMY